MLEPKATQGWGGSRGPGNRLKQGKIMVHDSILVLNKSWTPIATTTLKRGFSLVFQDRARIVDAESYELHSFESWLVGGSMPINQEPPQRERWLRTASLWILVPEVIVLQRFNGVPRRELTFSRRNIYRRDGFTCQYCGIRPGLKQLSIDHVLPLSRGGRTSWENCVVACVKCNTRKGDRTPEEARMPIAREPFRPSFNDGVGLGVRIPASWERFVGRVKKEVLES